LHHVGLTNHFTLNWIFKKLGGKVRWLGLILLRPVVSMGVTWTE